MSPVYNHVIVNCDREPLLCTLPASYITMSHSRTRFQKAYFTLGGCPAHMYLFCLTTSEPYWLGTVVLSILVPSRTRALQISAGLTLVLSEIPQESSYYSHFRDRKTEAQGRGTTGWSATALWTPGGLGTEGGKESVFRCQGLMFACRLNNVASVYVTLLFQSNCIRVINKI